MILNLHNLINKILKIHNLHIMNMKISKVKRFNIINNSKEKNICQKLQKLNQKFILHKNLLKQNFIINYNLDNIRYNIKLI
jgi:hypothetical protein